MELELVFSKVNDTRYLIAEGTELFLYANDILKEISNNTVSEYEENINIQLLDAIICRVVSSKFLEQNKLTSTELNFVTIDVRLPNRTLIIKVGVTNFNNQQKKLDGVLYV